MHLVFQSLTMKKPGFMADLSVAQRNNVQHHAEKGT